MVVHQAKLQHKQAFLFRLVDIANELFAMAASVARAHGMRRGGPSRRRPRPRSWPTSSAATRGGEVLRLFRELWSNDDVRKYKVALKVLDGKHAWLEKGILPLNERGNHGVHRPEPAEGKAEAVPVAKTRPVGTR